MTSPTVLMMAGGTGGHVFPALAVATELSERGYAVQWLGSERGIENRLVPGAGLTLHTLAVAGIRGGGVLRKLTAPLMLLKTVAQAFALVRRIRPVVAVGFGGYASGPGGVAARLAGVPLVLHEQNARPGLTNRVLSRMASRVLQAFPGALPGAQAVGNPVRRDIVALPDPVQRLESHDGPLRVLVLGGSQGALSLNTRLPGALATAIAGADVALTIRHQCGRGRVDEVISAYAGTGLDARCEEFIDSMESAYAWADLVICRAGALTVSEVAAAGVAAVFVPLPTAVDDHQTLNARWLSDEQAARLLPESALDGAGLAQALEGLLNREGLMAMAVRARAKGLADAASRVADVCEEVRRG